MAPPETAVVFTKLRIIAVKYNKLIPMNLQSVNSTMLGELQ